MTQNPHYLTGSDVGVLKQNLRDVKRIDRRLNQNPPNNAPTTPDIHVFKIPDGGVPGMTDDGEDPPVFYYPGTVECDIYKIDIFTNQPTLHEVVDHKKQIYNIGGPIHGEGFRACIKTKAGVYVAIDQAEKLYAFVLNEDMGETEENEVAANLLEWDYTTTIETSVTLLDNAENYTWAKQGAKGVCINVDDEYHIIELIPPGSVNVVASLNGELTQWDNDEFEAGCETLSADIVTACGAEFEVGTTIDVIFIRQQGREVNPDTDWIVCAPVDLTAEPPLYVAVEGYLKATGDPAAVASLNAEIADWPNGESFAPGCSIASAVIVASCGSDHEVGTTVDIIVPYVRDKVPVLDSGDHVGIVPVDLEADPPLYLITTDYTGYLEDCGIEIVDGKIKVNNEELKGKGLIEGEGCSLDVDIGCGLQFVGNEVWVDPEDLAGPGLIESGSCGLAVNAGCGLQIVEDVLLVDNKALAGQGLVATQECELEVNYGCGLNIDTGQLVLDFKVNEGNVSGISFDKDCFEVEGNEKCGTAEVSLKIGSPTQEFEYVYEAKCVDGETVYYTKFAQFTECGLFVGISDESLEEE